MLILTMLRKGIYLYTCRFAAYLHATYNLETLSYGSAVSYGGEQIALI